MVLRTFLCLALLAACSNNNAVANPIPAPNFKPAIALGVAGLATVVVGVLMNTEKLQALLEEKAIDAWIEKNNLNQFGESKDTVYENSVNGPLKWNQSRIDYIKEKFVDEDVKPWRSGFKRLLDYTKGLGYIAKGALFSGHAAMLVAGLIGAYLQIKYENALVRQSSELFKQALIDAVKSNPSVVTITN